MAGQPEARRLHDLVVGSAVGQPGAVAAQASLWADLKAGGCAGARPLPCCPAATPKDLSAGSGCWLPAAWLVDKPAASVDPLGWAQRTSSALGVTWGGSALLTHQRGLPAHHGHLESRGICPGQGPKTALRPWSACFAAFKLCAGSDAYRAGSMASPPRGRVARLPRLRMRDDLLQASPSAGWGRLLAGRPMAPDGLGLSV